MALENMDLKRPKLVSFEGDQTVKEREEEERRRSSRRIQGMELLTLYMNSIMNHMDFVWDSREGYEFQI